MTITTRSTKGHALTYDEMDENFRDLRYDTSLHRITTNGNTTTNDITINNLTANNIVVNSITVLNKDPDPAESTAVPSLEVSVLRAAFYEYSANVSQNTVITAGRTALTYGPITIDPDVYLEVPEGSTLIIS